VWPAVGANRDDSCAPWHDMRFSAGCYADLFYCDACLRHAFIRAFTPDGSVAAVACRLLQLASLFGIIDAVNIVPGACFGTVTLSLRRSSE